MSRTIAAFLAVMSLLFSAPALAADLTPNKIGTVTNLKLNGESGDLQFARYNIRELVPEVLDEQDFDLTLFNGETINFRVIKRRTMFDGTEAILAEGTGQTFGGEQFDNAAFVRGSRGIAGSINIHGKAFMLIETERGAMIGEIGGEPPSDCVTNGICSVDEYSNPECSADCCDEDGSASSPCLPKPEESSISGICWWDGQCKPDQGEGSSCYDCCLIEHYSNPQVCETYNKNGPGPGQQYVDPAPYVNRDVDVVVVIPERIHFDVYEYTFQETPTSPVLVEYSTVWAEDQVSLSFLHAYIDLKNMYGAQKIASQNPGGQFIIWPVAFVTSADATELLTYDDTHYSASENLANIESKDPLNPLAGIGNYFRMQHGGDAVVLWTDNHYCDLTHTFDGGAPQPEQAYAVFGRSPACIFKEKMAARAFSNMMGARNTAFAPSLESVYTNRWPHTFADQYGNLYSGDINAAPFSTPTNHRRTPYVSNCVHPFFSCNTYNVYTWNGLTYELSFSPDNGYGIFRARGWAKLSDYYEILSTGIP